MISFKLAEKSGMIIVQTPVFPPKLASTRPCKRAPSKGCFWILTLMLPCPTKADWHQNPDSWRADRQTPAGQAQPLAGSAPTRETSQADHFARMEQAQRCGQQGFKPHRARGGFFKRQTFAFFILRMHRADRIDQAALQRFNNSLSIFFNRKGGLLKKVW